MAFVKTKRSDIFPGAIVESILHIPSRIISIENGCIRYKHLDDDNQMYYTDDFSHFYKNVVKFEQLSLF